MTSEKENAQKTAQRLEAMPKLEVDNLLKASKEELAREVVNLRLFVAQLFLEVKGMRQHFDQTSPSGLTLERDTEA